MEVMVKEMCVDQTTGVHLHNTVAVSHGIMVCVRKYDMGLLNIHGWKNLFEMSLPENCT